MEEKKKAKWLSKRIRSHTCPLLAILHQEKCFFFLFLHGCHVHGVLKCADKDLRRTKFNRADSLQTCKGAFLKWWEQKLNRKGWNLDCFSIYGLRRAFKSFVHSGDRTRQRSETSARAHRCVCTRHFQHLSLWSLSGPFFHLHRKLSCALSFIPQETRSEEDRER